MGNVKLLYILPMLSKVPTRSEISICKQICSGCIFLAKTKVLGTIFKTEVQRKFPYFKNLFNSAIVELPPKLQLKVINLQCNDMLKANIKRKT